MKEQSTTDKSKVRPKDYLDAAGKLGYCGWHRYLVAFDMFWWRKFYHCFPDEYQLFRFDYLKPFYRKQYLLRFDQYITYAKVNFPTGLKNKITQYERFGSLIGRDWIAVNPAKLDEVRSFAMEHKKVLFKPRNSSLGKGIFSYEPAVDSEEKLFYLLQMCTAYHYICEEYVIQHPLLASFHSQSVNTVRVLTFSDGKQIQFLAATLKMGVSDAEVDNIGHGGLGANIDLETGIVNTPAYDFDEKPYYFHPESGVKIIGTEIPHFEQVLQVARKGVELVPECAVIGWDIAIKQDGVSIIEMNNNPSVRIIQACDKIPRGKEIKEFVRTNKEHVRKVPREERKKHKKCY